MHILAYRTTDKREWKDETFKWLQNFERSYSGNRLKRQFNHQFEIGQFGVVNHDGRPRRVQIVNIIDEGNAKVKFLDIPGELTFKGTDIQYLMEEYRDQNDITLYIGGVVPGEGNWHSSLTTHVRNVLMGESDGRQYGFESKVILHLNGQIMVDDVIRTNVLNDKLSPRFSVKKMLNAKDTHKDRTGLDNLLECYARLGKLCTNYYVLIDQRYSIMYLIYLFRFYFMLIEESDIQDSSDVESIAAEESSVSSQNKNHATHESNGIHSASRNSLSTGKRITIDLQF